MSTSVITPTVPGMDWYTLLNTAISNDGSTHYFDTMGNRDITKATMLIFTPFADTAWRNSIIIPASLFSNKISDIWVRTNDEKYWIDVAKVTDTKVSVLASSNLPSDARIAIMALAPLGTY